MPKITAIKPQKKKDRVNIFLDGKFAFGLDLFTAGKFDLKKGKDLSQKEVKKILKEGEFQKILDKLLKLAALRPRSEKEIFDWFEKYTTPKIIRRDLLKKLRKLELLDDKKFAVWWIEQRTTFKPRGRFALFSELKRKGLKRNLIEEALRQADIPEEKLAKKVLDKKLPRWEKLPKLKAKKKMSDFLARRGFSWDVINKTIKELGY